MHVGTQLPESCLSLSLPSVCKRACARIRYHFFCACDAPLMQPAMIIFCTREVLAQKQGTEGKRAHFDSRVVSCTCLRSALSGK
eukprot:9482892-Pyramimonas_sp.AAC.1